MLDEIENKTVESVEEEEDQITLYFTDGTKVQFYANIHEEADYSLLY